MNFWNKRRVNAKLRQWSEASLMMSRTTMPSKPLSKLHGLVHGYYTLQSSQLSAWEADCSMLCSAASAMDSIPSFSLPKILQWSGNQANTHPSRCSRTSYPTASTPASMTSPPNPSSSARPAASLDVYRSSWRAVSGSGRDSRNSRHR